MFRTTDVLGALVATSAMLAAQQPFLTLAPRAIPLQQNQGTVRYSAVARPGAAFALLADLEAGSHRLLGEHLSLGLSPFLAVIDVGTMSAFGGVQKTLSLPVTTANVGQSLFFQHISLAAQMPNGLFQASNGASLVVYDAPSAVVETFAVPRANFTGHFADVKNRLEGIGLRTRVHSTVDTAGIPFLSGISNPLNSFGSRLQMVFRPQDVGATGEEEVLTAIRWRPFFGVVQTESFEQLELVVGHSHVMPDYSVGTFSALPNFPLSGLDPLFANNYAPGHTPVSVWKGRYDITPGALRRDGYLGYPKATVEFEYNGVDSLLIEVLTSPNRVPTASVNGQFGQLMVQSSPRPNARNQESGNWRGNGVVIDPSRVVRGSGDNFMYDYQLEFVRYRSTATSPVYGVNGNPGAYDWQPPVLAAHVPPGTKLELEFRGWNPTQPTVWSNSVDVADGLPAIQFRVTFSANRLTGAVPWLGTIVIPAR